MMTYSAENREISLTVLRREAGEKRRERKTKERKKKKKGRKQKKALKASIMAQTKIVETIIEGYMW